MDRRPRRATPLADSVERHELAVFTRWGLGARLPPGGAFAEPAAPVRPPPAPPVRAAPP